MLVINRTVGRTCSRLLSSLWEKRIDDFTPVNISSKGNVHITHYNWRENSIEPKTKVFLPGKGSSLDYEGKQLNVQNYTEELYAEIPVKSPLSVRCEDGAAISILGHEANISATTNSGMVTLKKVKCQATEVVSKTGDIDVGSIVSNCTLMTKGDITAKKIQGESLSITNSTGNVRIGALYAPQSQIYCKYGHVSIDHVHGTCKIVNGSGDIKIGSSKDNIIIKSRGGDVNITLQEIERQVFIESYGGKISLFLSDEVCRKAMLNIQSSGVAKVTDDIQQKLNENMEAEALIHITGFNASVFVGKAKGWGDALWSSLNDHESDETK